MSNKYERGFIFDEEPYNGLSSDSYSRESYTREEFKTTDAFSSIKREVTEADLQSIGTQRWLLDEHDKYLECRKQLDELKEKYHDCDKAKCLAEAKLSTDTSFEVLYSTALSLGSALIGIAVTSNDGIKWIILSIGCVMLLGGVAAKILTNLKQK